jgi:hypothetical protein
MKGAMMPSKVQKPFSIQYVFGLLGILKLKQYLTMLILKRYFVVLLLIAL